RDSVAPFLKINGTFIVEKNSDDKKPPEKKKGKILGILSKPSSAPLRVCWPCASTFFSRPAAFARVAQLLKSSVMRVLFCLMDGQRNRPMKSGLKMNSWFANIAAKSRPG